MAERRVPVQAANDGGVGDRRFRIAGLVGSKNGFLGELERLARGTPTSEPLWEWARLEEARRRMGDVARRAATLCRERGKSPADLPSPSRRAYRLLSFLSANGHIEAHLEALRVMQAASARLEPRLDHTGFVYRYERSAEKIVLHASEAFLHAPADVLASLVRLAVPYARKRVPRDVVREYVEGPAFAAAIQAIEASGGASASRTAGASWDLMGVFLSVNREYFDARLTPPRLAWTSGPTYREFGHYEPTTDTVRISRTLDRAEVPAFVLEHVMHHELLHRTLGAEGVNGRRRYHSPRFRLAERAFRGFSEAEAFLRKLAEGVDR